MLHVIAPVPVPAVQVVTEEKPDPIEPTENTDPVASKESDISENKAEDVTPVSPSQPEDNSTIEPPTTFDPFNITTDIPENPITEEPPAPPPPAPPAPSFDPFATEPPSPSVKPESAVEAPPAQEEKVEIAPPPPPPAPTFNPFENDPLPLPPSELSTEGGVDNKEGNPFDSVDSDSNQTSVPLENIFNTPPPEDTPADNFNPFDLPTEN